MAQEGNGEVVQPGEGLRLHHPDDGGEHIFVHYTGIQGTGFRSLEEGEKVSYEAIPGGQRGMKAENVSKAS